MDLIFILKAQMTLAVQPSAAVSSQEGLEVEFMASRHSIRYTLVPYRSVLPWQHLRTTSSGLLIGRL
jgi:hypothetical protein